MSLKRIGTLLGKEFLSGSKGYIFIMAIIIPLVVSLLLNLIFGTLFADKADLGITGATESEMVRYLEEAGSLDVTLYDDENNLQAAVRNGRVDMGVVIPPGFDTSVTPDSRVSLDGFIWGESLTKHRLTISAAITDAARNVAGVTSPVSIESVTLGDEAAAPWNDRMLPLVVLMAIFLGGLMIPATSVITEKNNRTLQALLVTPASTLDVFTAKGLTGLIISLFMGMLILLINQAFGNHSLLLVMVLALGGIMAVLLGLIFGILMKDFAALFTVWKMGGIILFAPALVYLFPAIPEWIGRIFPTYYFINPIVDISLGGGGWSDITTNVLILLGINVILSGILTFTLKRTRQFAAA